MAACHRRQGSINRENLPFISVPIYSDSAPSALLQIIYRFPLTNKQIYADFVANSLIISKNIEKTSNSILRAQAIINELNGTLDETYEISKNLSDIYTFMNARLIDANLEKNTDIIKEVLGFAEELRDTWREAMQLAR